jgi:rod shape-determining protein MreD
MKRTLVIIVFFIISLFAYFLQSNFFNWYNIAGIQPNLFIILILTIGLYLGEKYGFSLGIILGLLLDLFIGKRIGLNAIMLGIAGLIGGILDRSFSKESRITFMIMTIAVTVLCEVINFTLQIILLGAEPVFMQCMKIIMIEAIYNAILIIILYPLIQKMGNKTEEIFREKKSLMKYY